jgi:rhodanese-related sulfurtransferase
MKPTRLSLTILHWTFVAWVLVNGLAFPARAGDAVSEPEKRAEIETMYRDYKKEFADVQDIEPAAAMELLKRSPAVFVDVREEKEQAVSMLPGAITEQEFLNHLERYRDVSRHRLLHHQLPQRQARREAQGPGGRHSQSARRAARLGPRRRQGL